MKCSELVMLLLVFLTKFLIVVLVSVTVFVCNYWWMGCGDGGRPGRAKILDYFIGAVYFTFFRCCTQVIKSKQS